MAIQNQDARPWWKEPMVWLIAGLPAIAVVASFATYFIAASDPDTLVKSDYRKEGMAVTETLTEAELRAGTMGIIGRLSAKEGQLSLVLKGNMEMEPERIALNIIHPTKEKQDIHILLARSGKLSYIAQAPDAGHGKRILVLEPEDRVWRITGQWMAPFSGMTELAAAVMNPSTHP